jgi:GntR family transcriptional regulator, phosphonate transport system regulatory protein
MWKIIADELETAIRERRLNPGDKLPTEHQLVRKYYATRHMVRLALQSLAKRGLIHSYQGRGSYVSRPTLPIHIKRRTRFGEIVKQAGASHVYHTLRLEIITPPAHVAREFGVKLQTPMICLERLSIVNEQATGISTHYFIASRLPDFIDRYQQTGSITASLRALGISDYVRVQTRIQARLPLPGEAELLSMPQHIPLILTQAVNHDLAGNMLEYGEARTAADRVELVIEAQEDLDPENESPAETRKTL